MDMVLVIVSQQHSRPFLNMNSHPYSVRDSIVLKNNQMSTQKEKGCLRDRWALSWCLKTLNMPINVCGQRDL